MPNIHTISVATEIDRMLGKLWVDGDISSYDRQDIIEVVDKKLR